MATFTFPTLSELVTYLQGVIAANGTEAITGQVHQDAVVTMANSLVAIVSSVPPATTNQFNAWSAGTTYPGGQEVIVRHVNKLWLFVSATNSTGVTPGTNSLVWLEISAAQLAHFRNKDQYLDLDGPKQVSAQEIYDLIHQPGGSTVWIPPVQQHNVASEAVADASSWTRVIVSPSPSGTFTGQGNKLAVKTAGVWGFTDIAIGALVENSTTGNLLIRRVSGWNAYNVSIPTLAAVMAVGNTTAGTIYFAGATVRNPSAVNHTVAGNLNVVMANIAHLQVQLSANVTIVPTGMYVGGEWVIVLRGMAAVTVAFGSDVFFPSGVTAPTSIALNEVIVMQAFGAYGKLAIRSVSRYTGIV